MFLTSAEDDMKYDTPYDLDRQGHHINLRFTPQRNINIFVGSFRTRGLGLDTRTDDDYIKVLLNYNVFTVGNINVEYRYEQIQDNVQNSFFIVPTSTIPRSEVGTGSLYDRYFYYDELEYRNSKVNKLFLDSRIRAIPSVTIENHIKYERNIQIEGTMYGNTFQPEDILTTFAKVNKFVYTK